MCGWIAAALVLWATTLLPLGHTLHHENDHTHGPQGVTRHLHTSHSHHGGESHAHDHHGEGHDAHGDGPDEDDERPFESDHGADALEHFGAALAPAQAVLPPLLAILSPTLVLVPIGRATESGLLGIDTRRCRGPPLA